MFDSFVSVLSVPDGDVLLRVKVDSGYRAMAINAAAFLHSARDSEHDTHHTFTLLVVRGDGVLVVLDHHGSVLGEHNIGRVSDLVMDEPGSESAVRNAWALLFDRQVCQLQIYSPSPAFDVNVNVKIVHCHSLSEAVVPVPTLGMNASREAAVVRSQRTGDVTVLGLLPGVASYIVSNEQLKSTEIASTMITRACIGGVTGRTVAMPSGAGLCSISVCMGGPAVRRTLQ